MFDSCSFVGGKSAVGCRLIPVAVPRYSVRRGVGRKVTSVTKHPAQSPYYHQSDYPFNSGSPNDMPKLLACAPVV